MEAWSNLSMVNVTFRRMNLTSNLVFTGASVWSRSAMTFKKLFSRRDEVAPNENTSQTRPHHRSVNTSILVTDAAAQVPCATPPAQPEGKITAWKQGATVTVGDSLAKILDVQQTSPRDATYHSLKLSHVTSFLRT